MSENEGYAEGVRGGIVAYFVFSSVEPSIYKPNKFVYEGDFITWGDGKIKNVRLVLSSCNTSECKGSFSNSKSWESLESMGYESMGYTFRFMIDSEVTVMQGRKKKAGSFMNDKSFLLRYTEEDDNYQYIEVKRKDLK